MAAARSGRHAVAASEAKQAALTPFSRRLCVLGQQSGTTAECLTFDNPVMAANTDWEHKFALEAVEVWATEVPDINPVGPVQPCHWPFLLSSLSLQTHSGSSCQ